MPGVRSYERRGSAIQEEPREPSPSPSPGGAIATSAAPIAIFRGHDGPEFRIIERRNLWFASLGTLIVLSLVGLFVAAG